MRSLYYAIRCMIGKPICYRKYPSNSEKSWWFATCKHCHRQAEIHR